MANLRNVKASIGTGRLTLTVTDYDRRDAGFYGMSPQMKAAITLFPGLQARYDAESNVVVNKTTCKARFYLLGAPEMMDDNIITGPMIQAMRAA